MHFGSFERGRLQQVAMRKRPEWKIIAKRTYPSDLEK